jgi:hypothetical protein
MILAKWGEAGSNLYVSLSFVAVLIIVGGYVFYDAWTTQKSGAVDQVAALALRLQKINLPPMIHFKTANLTISLWFTIPVGFATGMLAATIAVGGFVGVPGMIYVVGASGLISSATELVIAFLMGLGGSVKWAIHGMVDIRLTLIILAGSLLGVQLGAIGTTYVKEHMIKVVMGTIMVVVAVSRALAVPKYLEELGLMSISKTAISYLDLASFLIMCLALAVGAVIILGAMWKGKRAAAEPYAAPIVAKEGYEHV